ncbi:hypothetical protein BGZ81_001095 [Podila clonocystis]|nr:hypothetical protein BGZ81_001095 [Podila clonocystis]
MFVTAGATQGRLSGVQAEEVLRNTRLPSTTRSKIWNIAIANNTGSFDATWFNITMFYSKLIMDGFLVNVPNVVPLAVLKACSGTAESDDYWPALNTFGLNSPQPVELRHTLTSTATATRESGANFLLQDLDETKREIMKPYHDTKTHKDDEQTKKTPDIDFFKMPADIDFFQMPAFGEKAKVVDLGQVRSVGTVMNQDSEPDAFLYTEPKFEERRREDLPEEDRHKDSGEQLSASAEDERKRIEELVRASLEDEHKRHKELLLQSIAEERRKAKQQEELYRKAIEQEAFKRKAIEEQYRKELAQEQCKKVVREEQIHKDMIGAGSVYQFNMETYLKEQENQKRIQQGLLEQYIKEQSEQQKALTEQIFKGQQAQFSKVYQEQLAQILQAASGSLAPSVPNLPPWLQSLHEEDVRNRQKFYTDLLKNTTDAGASDAVVNLCNSVIGLDLGAPSSSTSNSQPFVSPPSSTGPAIVPPGSSSYVPYQPKQDAYPGSASLPVVPLPTPTSNPASSPLYGPHTPFNFSTSPPSSGSTPIYQEPDKFQHNPFQRPYQQEQYPQHHAQGQYPSFQLPGQQNPPSTYISPVYGYQTSGSVQYQPFVSPPHYGQTNPSPLQQQPYQQQQQHLPMIQTQDQQPIPGSPSNSSNHVIIRAKAMYDFAGQDRGDLSFKAGDTINVIDYMNDDWWRGSLGKNYGVFPSTYVQKLDSDSDVHLLEVIAQVRAKWDFSAKNEGDLSFKYGDTINVVEYVNDDWWRGVLGINIGNFPTNYVQKLNPPANGIYPSVVVFSRPTAVEEPFVDLGRKQQQSNTYLPSPPSKDAYIPPPSQQSHYPLPSSSKDAYIPKNPQQLVQHPSYQPYAAQSIPQRPQQYDTTQNQTKRPQAPQYIPPPSLPSLPPRAPQYREPLPQTPHLSQRAPQYHPQWCGKT